MTTQTLTQPTPRKPWNPTKREKSVTLGVLLTGVISASLAVEFTGLKGKIGFALVFITVASLLNIIVSVNK